MRKLSLNVLQILCYDSIHNRAFEFFEFYDNLDPSDFSPGTLDILFSIETKEKHVFAFRLLELPGKRAVAWVSKFKQIKQSSELNEIIDISTLLATYFGFKFMMIEPSAVVNIPVESFINKGFLRLIDTDLNTVLLYKLL